MAAEPWDVISQDPPWVSKHYVLVPATERMLHSGCMQCKELIGYCSLRCTTSLDQQAHPPPPSCSSPMLPEAALHSGGSLTHISVSSHGTDATAFSETLCKGDGSPGNEVHKLAPYAVAFLYVHK